ncbi:hypothetical protein PGT21_021744 [Puccinia graminis f. sp. tritici]|uniref:Uncharacterized protein n=1 Tax=Puccinia graminis f. sp. tritici TaxID=56615 RepID=A0A5B0MPE3_PUCGR|nr:hypothetical protein PGT21_021744 [Puccinia graminis f. sp. tritici]
MGWLIVRMADWVHPKNRPRSLMPKSPPAQLQFILTIQISHLSEFKYIFGRMDGGVRA